MSQMENCSPEKRIRDKFLAGEYIVIFESGNNNSNTLEQFPPFFCFKQKVDSEILTPEIDGRRNINNAWRVYQYDDNSNWRYATNSEVIAYNLEKKPFDTRKIATKDNLILGFCNIGDIVVSLNIINTRRKKGDIFKVLSNSSITNLYYKEDYNSRYKEDWRLATPEEKLAFESGITNIKDIKKKLSHEELIEKSKKDYPIGTIFYSAHTGKLGPCKVTDHSKIFIETNEDVYLESGGNKSKNGHNYNQLLRFKGKWAEIISLPKTEVKEEWIPKVGDHVIMTNAGGWGYHPANNGCCAIIEFVGKKSILDVGEVISIGGKVINPNSVNDTAEFSNVPIINSDKEEVFRKALDSEIPKQELAYTWKYKVGDEIILEKDNTNYFDYNGVFTSTVNIAGDERRIAELSSKVPGLVRLNGDSSVWFREKDLSSKVITKVKWRIGDKITFRFEKTEYFDESGQHNVGSSHRKGESFVVGGFSTKDPNLFRFKLDEDSNIWYMGNDFELYQESKKDLLQEARDRGFKNGCTYISTPSKSEYVAIREPRFCSGDHNNIECGDGWIYKDGIWGTLVEEPKPEIDSWYVKVTEENQSVLKEYYKKNFNKNWDCFIGHYYGVDKKGIPDCASFCALRLNVISTEEFYRKIGHNSVPDLIFDSCARLQSIPKEVPKWTVGGYVKALTDGEYSDGCIIPGNIYKVNLNYNSSLVEVEIGKSGFSPSLIKDKECEWIGMEKPTWLENFNISVPLTCTGFFNTSSAWSPLKRVFSEEEILNRAFNQELVIKTKNKQVKTKLKLEL